jgi:hypothetical protein
MVSSLKIPHLPSLGIKHVEEVTNHFRRKLWTCQLLSTKKSGVIPLLWCRDPKVSAVRSDEDIGHRARRRNSRQTGQLERGILRHSICPYGILSPSCTSCKTIPRSRALKFLLINIPSEYCSFMSKNVLIKVTHSGI